MVPRPKSYYFFGFLFGSDFSNHAKANANTAAIIIISPTSLKNAQIMFGIVWPNKTYTKFENDKTPTAVSMKYLNLKIDSNFFIFLAFIMPIFSIKLFLHKKIMIEIFHL